MDFHSSGREWLKISEIPSIEIKTHNRLVAQLHVPNARRIRNLGKSESNKFSQSNWVFVHNERKSSKRSCFFSWWTGMISRSSLWDTSISATTNSSQASTMNYSPHKYSNREASESSNAEVSRYHSFPRKQCETNQFPALSIFPFHLRFGTTCTTNLVMAQKLGFHFKERKHDITWPYLVCLAIGDPITWPATLDQRSTPWLHSMLCCLVCFKWLPNNSLFITGWFFHHLCF